MKQKSLNEILVDLIRDTYDAEKQLLKALPKLAKAAESEELSEALLSHLEQTKTQVKRLEEVFGLVGVEPRGKACKGMKGLLDEGNETVESEAASAGRDLALIAGCQKVEHYEISAYGTMSTLAEHLGLSQAVDLLQETEEEEKEADSKLTIVAVSIYETFSESVDKTSALEEEPKRARHAQ